MKLSIALTLAISLLGSQASALSCIQTDVATTYLDRAASEKRYAIFVGQISYDKGNYTQDELQEGISIPAQFVGQHLGHNGVSAPLIVDMTVSIGCFGPWCGFVDDSPNTISFVEITDDGYFLGGSPCPGAQYTADDPEIWRALQMCLNGRECEASY